MKFTTILIALFLLVWGQTPISAISVSDVVGGPRIEKKLGLDSTVFTMTFLGKQPVKEGKTFQVRIHVSPGKDWHVYSSKMSGEEGLTPLTLVLPEELSSYFSIESLKETGKLTTGYDSNFMTVTMAHYAPFDIIATIKVTKKADSPLPFYLLLHFQTCNEYMCMPPRTFAIPMTFLGQAPITLRIAEADENRVGFQDHLTLAAMSR